MSIFLIVTSPLTPMCMDFCFTETRFCIKGHNPELTQTHDYLLCIQYIYFLLIPSSIIGNTTFD